MLKLDDPSKTVELDEIFIKQSNYNRGTDNKVDWIEILFFSDCSRYSELLVPLLKRDILNKFQINKNTDFY